MNHDELLTLLKLICSDLNAVTGGESGLSATAYADLVNLKTSVDTSKTAVDELIDDHATFKTLADATKTLVNDIRTQLLADTVDGATALAIGSTKPNVAHGAFTYRINGQVYSVDADAVGTALSGVNIPDAKAGGWALDINDSGVITIIEATGNAAGYDTEALAKAGIPAIAVADTVRLGTVTVLNSGAIFDPGTTNLDAVTVSNVTYTNAVPALVSLGAAVSANSPATLTAAKPTAMPAITTIGS
jgi:hypothetical protein